MEMAVPLEKFLVQEKPKGTEVTLFLKSPSMYSS